MSKKYICDMCETVIDNPYSVKMREFYIGADYECGTVFPIPIKTSKFKIHICGDCFRTLKNIKDKKEKCDDC